MIWRRVGIAAADQFRKDAAPTYFDDLMPRLLKPAIGLYRREFLRDAVRGQGIGSLARSERREEFDMEIRALSDCLGAGRYLTGERVASFDATAYAWLVALTHGPREHEVCDAVRSFPNLAEYVERMRAEFWPGIDRTE